MSNLVEHLDYLLELSDRNDELIGITVPEYMKNLKDKINGAKEKVTSLGTNGMLYSVRKKEQKQKTEEFEIFKPDNVLSGILSYAVTKTNINPEIPNIVASFISSVEINGFNDEFEFVGNLYTAALSSSNTFHNRQELLKVLRYYLPFTNELAFTTYCSTLMNPMNYSNGTEQLKLLAEYRIRYLKLKLAIVYADFNNIADKLNTYYNNLQTWVSNGGTGIFSMDMNEFPFNIAEYCIDKEIANVSYRMKWELVKINSINAARNSIFVDLNNINDWYNKYGRKDKFTYKDKRNAMYSLPITTVNVNVQDYSKQSLMDITGKSNITNAIQDIYAAIQKVIGTDSIEDAIEKVLTVQNKESNAQILKNINELSDQSARDIINDYCQFSFNASGYYKLRYFITGRNCTFTIPIINHKINVVNIDVENIDLPTLYLPDEYESRDYMELIKAQYESKHNYIVLDESTSKTKSVELHTKYPEFFNKNNTSLYHTLAIVVRRKFDDCIDMNFYQIVPVIFFDDFVRTVRADFKCIESPIYPYALIRWIKNTTKDTDIKYDQLNIAVDDNSKYFIHESGKYFSKVGLYNVALDYVNFNCVDEEYYEYVNIFVPRDAKYVNLKAKYANIVNKAVGGDEYVNYIKKFKYDIDDDREYDLFMYLITLNIYNKGVIINGSNKKIFSTFKVLTKTLIEQLRKDVTVRDTKDTSDTVNQLTKYNANTNVFHFYTHIITVPNSPSAHYNRLFAVIDRYPDFKPIESMTLTEAQVNTRNIKTVKITINNEEHEVKAKEMTNITPTKTPTKAVTNTITVDSSKPKVPISFEGMKSNKPVITRTNNTSLTISNSTLATNQPPKKQQESSKFAPYRPNQPPKKQQESSKFAPYRPNQQTQVQSVKTTSFILASDMKQSVDEKRTDISKYTRISLYNDKLSNTDIYINECMNAKRYIQTLSNVFNTRNNLYIIAENSTRPIVKLDIVCSERYVLEVCLYDYLVVANAYHLPIINTSILFRRLYNDMELVIHSSKKLIEKLDTLWDMFDLSRLQFKSKTDGEFAEFAYKTITFENVARYISYNLDKCISYNLVHGYLLYKFLKQNGKINIDSEYDIQYELGFNVRTMYINAYTDKQETFVYAKPLWIALNKDNVEKASIISTCKTDKIMRSVYFNLVPLNNSIGPKIQIVLPDNELFNAFNIKSYNYVSLQIACTVVNKEIKITDTKKKFEFMLMLYNKMNTPSIINQRRITNLEV